MKILFLGYIDSPLINHLRSLGDEVLVNNDKVSPAFVKENSIDFIVSYGYRHIIKSDVIQALPDKIVNLHVALLPWNRGADPNLWSFLENTPKGVTIHYVDESLDTGDIIVQKQVDFVSDETLKTSYAKLKQSIEKLFTEHWNKIKNGKCPRMKQSGKGTFHKVKDKQPFLHLLTKDFDTLVSTLVGKATLDNKKQSS